MTDKKVPKLHSVQHYFALVLTLGLFVFLLGWSAKVQIAESDELSAKAEQRFYRTSEIPAYRGEIRDRFGNPLAVSSPVFRVVVNPKLFVNGCQAYEDVAQILGLNVSEFKREVQNRSKAQYYSVMREVMPEQKKDLESLSCGRGIQYEREYKRYFLTGEINGHLIGFTDTDDHGIEGLERTLENVLSGSVGKKAVLKDGRGRIIENLGEIEQPTPGQHVELTIDNRLQFLTYRALKKAYFNTKAKSASAILIDSDSGEILAMASQPPFNPNNREELKPKQYRNRVLADQFEPGSTLKPLTLAKALDMGVITPETEIDTERGRIRLNGFKISDYKNYGNLTAEGIIQKSSNVGTAKVALMMGRDPVWDYFAQLGFASSAGLPNETYNKLKDVTVWDDATLAANSYGYGLAINLASLAKAYTMLANDGELKPVGILKNGPWQHEPSQQLVSKESARSIREMMVSVTEKGGTGKKAAVKDYKIAGKTGTVHVASAGGYDEDRYRSMFAGIAPATNPKLVMVIMVEEPQRGGYYGGEVAAPVFHEVVKEALRILDVTPDNLSHD